MWTLVLHFNNWGGGEHLKAWLKINTNSYKKVLRKESGQLQLYLCYLLRVARQLRPTTAPRAFYFTIRIFEGEGVFKKKRFFTQSTETWIYISSKNPCQSEHPNVKQLLHIRISYRTDTIWQQWYTLNSDILTLWEELFAICFEQNPSSCQIWTSRQSLV